MSTHVNFVASRKSLIDEGKFDVYIVRGVTGSGDPRIVHWDLVASGVEAPDLSAYDKVLPKLKGFFRYVDARGHVEAE